MEIEKERQCLANQHFSDGRRPAFLTEFDYPLVRREIDFVARFHGRKRREYEEALREWDKKSEGNPSEHARYARAAIKSIVFRRTTDKKALQPSAMRIDIFMQAQNLFNLGHSLEGAKELVVAKLSNGNLTSGQLQETLFADMANEAIIDVNRINNCHEQIVEIANRSLMKKILRQSLEVSFLFDGNVKNIVRTAKLKGLICQVNTDVWNDSQIGFRLQNLIFQNAMKVSGPLSIFQQTSIYADGLYSLFSQICYADRYLVFIDTSVRGELRRFRVQSGDAFRPGKPPKISDSRVEQRFMRDTSTLLRDWEVVREPFVIANPNDNSYLLPDFMLKNTLTREEVIVEIIGYWRSCYLDKKIAQYETLIREKPSLRIILCANRKFEKHFCTVSPELLQRTLFYDKFVCLHTLSKFLAKPAV
jgi:predicted nuclease of restriction endonuclease-like RecB superfamily